MRSVVCVVLAVPALLFAVLTQPVTVLPPEQALTGIEPAVSPKAPGRSAGGGFVIGDVDTVGGTTYDWQANGPALRMLVHSPDYGVHVLWMFSADQTTAFPDRNMGYNFYDYGTREWNWLDPDFMLSGVHAFTDRSGFGCLDADPATGVAIASCHQGSIYPYIARDVAPGAGLFEYCDGRPNLEGYLWPWVSAGSNGYLQVGLCDDATRNDLYWSRGTTWCNWDSPVTLAPPKPQPDFPDYCVAASKNPGSEKVAVTWVYSPDGYSQKPGFYRLSTDGGTTWDEPMDLSFPPAYLPDTLTSFHITSLFALFDLNDELHIAADVAPFYHDTNYILPAQIWHWCAANPDTWSFIHRGSDTIVASVGYNATMSCRPSMGIDASGNLFVAWEEFDGINYEPGPPERLRADIKYSHSSDNGQTWAEPVAITDGGDVTHRFPCIIDYITDTVMVAYLIDQHAGFFLYTEGPATNNPIVVQRWQNPYVGVAETGREPERLRMEARAAPSPFERQTRVSYTVPAAGEVSVVIYDVNGRPERSLVSGRSGPGRFSAIWDGRSDTGKELPAGVYLYRYSLGGDFVTGKVLLSR